LQPDVKVNICFFGRNFVRLKVFHIKLQKKHGYKIQWYIIMILSKDYKKNKINFLNLIYTNLVVIHLIAALGNIFFYEGGGLERKNCFLKNENV